MINYTPFNEQQATPERIRGIQSRGYKIPFARFNVQNGILLQHPNIEQPAPTPVEYSTPLPDNVVPIRPNVTPAVGGAAIGTVANQEVQAANAKEQELAAVRQNLRNINEIAA